MSVTLLQGDARALPLPDASVDLIVTSPPYFALRSYSDGGQHYAGQLGSEATPAEFIAALLECTREMVRVLKPTGSIWVNLGDKYSQRVALRRSSHQDGLFPDRPDLAKDWKRDRAAGLARMPHENVIDPTSGGYVPEKSLMLLPERYRIACVDQLGLIARAVVIWSKPNGMPESVTDRVRRSHEDWVHLTKSPRYFAAVDEIREPHSPISQRIAESGRSGRIGARQAPERNDADRTTRNLHALGKLPGSVWEIATQPLTVPAELGIDHFAAFPMEWPRRIILGWSPSGICTACGEGRRPVTIADGITPRQRGHEIGWNPRPGAQGLDRKGGHNERRRLTITGYACACACPGPTAPTRPAVVLDPFGGTGTTALVADVLGRHGISVDMSADYCRLAAWRTADPKQRERASRPAAASKRRVEPPAPPVEEDESAMLVPTSPAPSAIPIQRVPRTADEWLTYFAAMTQ